MARTRRPKLSALLADTWDVEDLGVVSVGTCTRTIAEQIDREWGTSRSESDRALAWSWAAIAQAMRETFVAQVDGVPVAVWAAKLGTSTVLSGRNYYRVDFLEVCPERRGDGRTSVALFGLIAHRAAEHRATAVLLAAFNEEGLAKFYESLGAKRGAPVGWNHPPDLVPFTIEQPALVELRELIDAYRKVPS